jgi:hypothetical protein
MANGINTPSPVKDAIDANSGRFEFLKQALTLGSAGIAGLAALFTDPTRVPADGFSKGTVLGGAIGLGIVVAFAIMGLSTYANLLTATASSDAKIQERVPVYAEGVRNHARWVIIGLISGFLGLGLFAGYRLLFASAAATPESAIEAATVLVSKETKQPAEGLLLTRMEADNDAFTVTYSLGTVGREVIVRVSKRDGSILRLTQEKKP